MEEDEGRFTPMNKYTVLETKDLTKQYAGNVTAVKNLNLSLSGGEVFGMLGPNGSGKTTTILMLLGLSEPTSGNITILGHDPRHRPLEIKRKVAFMPDNVGFYLDNTGYENLDYALKFLGLPARERHKRIDSAIAVMGLKGREHDRVKSYSHGMRRRLGLAEVLAKQPEIAILDEPIQGLDPESIQEFLLLIQKLKQDGISVLLSSHQLNEVQSVCDRVGLFYRGEMKICGTVEELSRQIMGGSYQVHIRSTSKLSHIQKALDQLNEIKGITSDESGSFLIECSDMVSHAIAKELITSDINLSELSYHRHTLDEVYRSYYTQFKEAAYA
jgi:ABC-2 type transport system ATP-binding protein